MSCSSPPPLEHHHDAARPTIAPALDLLDEHWFFGNTLVTNSSAKKKKKPPPHLPRSPSTATATATGEKVSGSAGPPARLGGRQLLRTPSLPSSRVGMTTELPLPTNNNKDDDDDLNWSSIYEGVLRTRLAEGGRSALRRAPSMPVPTSATAMGLLRHSHKAEAEQRTPGGGSSGNEPRRSKKQTTSPRRPYLSEAWQRPALVRVQSAAEMKDLLRMWAQAVACNVRHDTVSNHKPF